MRRSNVVVLAAALLATVAHAVDREPCLDLDWGRPAASALAATAVEILRAAGHDPADYRLELRVEDRDAPDFASLGGELVTSVVFHPAMAGERYALRVHVLHPCRVGWLWRPEEFTPWQQEAIERAFTAARRLRPGWTVGEETRVDVVESADRLGIRFRESRPRADPERRLNITLRKSDLGVVDSVERSP